MTSPDSILLTLIYVSVYTYNFLNVLGVSTLRTVFNVYTISTKIAYTLIQPASINIWVVLVGDFCSKLGI